MEEIVLSNLDGNRSFTIGTQPFTKKNHHPRPIILLKYAEAGHRPRREGRQC
jgi:hypothetical protein